MTGILEKLKELSYVSPPRNSAVYARVVDMDTLNEAVREITRLNAEVAALRASLGDHNGAEPVGCPIPGACACPTTEPQIDPRQTPAVNTFTERRKSMDLKQHLIRQIVFSRATFGPGERRKGVIDHIRKELAEVEASGGCPTEWTDVVILALDGLTRSITKQHACAADVAATLAAAHILEKQRKNELRDWPDWRTASPDKAIEHVRTENKSD